MFVPSGEKAKGKVLKGKVVPDSKCGWVSLWQRKRLFEMYEESVRGFKDVYYGGRPIEEDFAIFPFYWRKEHYSMIPTEFVFKLSELTADERSDYKKLETFVERLPPYLLEGPEGEPLYDEDGERVTHPKLIDTKGLLASDTPEKLTAFWQRMTSAAEKLRQARAAKNKRERGATNAAGASSGLGTSSVQMSPAPSFDTDRSKRIRVEDLDDTTSQKHQISSSFLRPSPHEALDGATKMKISLADEVILSDTGPKAICGEIASHSSAIFELLEIITFLNGREWKYLEERDATRHELHLLGKKLQESEASCEGYREQHKTLASNLEEAEEKMKVLVEERDGALKEVEEIKAKINELEGK
ncbi:hypothetical protein L195_g043381, partial [Trifolium pratense]